MWFLATLSDELVTILVGFALTTVVGGALGGWFQRRAWDHQNQRTLEEADRDHATQVCRELSHLMDKRLYRMRQLNWALLMTPQDESRVQATMDDYRAVLYEWNDGLNRNLAAAEIQFGGDVRGQLEHGIYEGFRAVGAKLEANYRRGRERDSADADGAFDDGAFDESLEQDLDELRERIYDLGVAMLRHIRDGRIGRRVLR
jgi:hypothetical protein